jgi:hypothetical protein
MNSKSIAILLLLGPLLTLGALPVMAQPAGHIYVVNSYSSFVSEYSTSGAPVNASLLMPPQVPNYVAISGNSLYLAQQGAPNQVGEYNATTGAAINSSLLTLSSGVAEGVAVSGGNLFLAVYGNNVIEEYNAATGAVINKSFITGLNLPTAIAISGNNLYVADDRNGGGGYIGEYNATTGAVINADLLPFYFPEGLAVSGNDLFVSGYGVGEFNATTGAAINSSLIPESSVGVVNGVAYFGGNLFVTSGYGDTVGEYSATTGATVNAALISGLSEPDGIAIIATPEPATWIMLAIGGAALLVCGLRRRQSLPC